MSEDFRPIASPEESLIFAQAHLEEQVRDALRKYPQKLLPEWTLGTFQDFARRAAQIVEMAGFQNVSPLLQAISQNVKDIGQEGWNDSIKLGNAFRKAVDPNPKVKPGNPFAGVKLG